MSVDIRKLVIFVAIVEEGSMTGAARKLEMTQPAVTLHLRTLERALDLPLFERSPFRLGGLTSHGERLLPIARRMLGHCSDFERAITTLRDNSHPKPRQKD